MFKVVVWKCWETFNLVFYNLVASKYIRVSQYIWQEEERVRLMEVLLNLMVFNKTASVFIRAHPRTNSNWLKGLPPCGILFRDILVLGGNNRKYLFVVLLTRSVTL